MWLSVADSVDPFYIHFSLTGILAQLALWLPVLLRSNSSFLCVAQLCAVEENRYLVLKPHLNNRTLHSGALWPLNPPIWGFSLYLMTSEVINIGLKLALSLDHLTGCFQTKPKPDEVQGNFDEHLTACWFWVCCDAYVHPHTQAMPLPMRETHPQTDSSHSQYTNTDLCRSKLNKFRMKAHYKFILRLTKDELQRPSNILCHILFLKIQFSQELLYCWEEEAKGANTSFIYLSFFFYLKVDQLRENVKV